MRSSSIFAAAAILLLPALSPAADWVLARSAAFVVVSDGGEDKARSLALEMETLRTLFRERFTARVDAGRPVIVFHVRDEAAMEQLIGPQGRRSIAGMFMSGADKHFVVLRADVQEERSIIYHEFTHLLLRLNYRWLPVWVNEGLATFYSTTIADETSVKWGFIGRHHLAVVRGVQMPLAEVLAVTPDSRHYNERDLQGPFYAYAALLTHYLFFEPSRQGQLRTFLKLIAEDVPEADAMKQAFGDLKVLERNLQAYSRRSAFHGVKVAATLEPGSVTTVPLKPHEADALRGDLMARRRLPHARRVLDGVLAVSPEAIAHEGMGIVEEDARRPKEAFRHFTEAARLAPRSAVGPYRLGLLELPGEADDRARREAALRSAVRINPLFANAHAALARVLLESGDARATEAANLAARASALDPGTVYYRVLLWYALDRFDKDKAVKVEESLRRGALADPQTLAQMAFHLEELGRPAEAEELLRKAQATNPSGGTIYENYLAERGRWQEALPLARAALARDPRSPTYQNTVAYYLAETGQELAEALDLVDRALKQSPKNPAYLDTRGLVLFRMKRLKEAEAVLREAVALDEDPEILDHLADVFAAAGKRDEAMGTWERALQMPDISSRRRESVQSKLKALQPASPG